MDFFRQLALFGCSLVVLFLSVLSIQTAPCEGIDEGRKISLPNIRQTISSEEITTNTDFGKPGIKLTNDDRKNTVHTIANPEGITIFMTGDVMTGRGIDQILPNPGDPSLFEPYVRNAKRYADLAREANGPIKQPVAYAYIWGDALAVIDRVSPDLRIINLETSITKSDDYWKSKSVHYRMNPENIACLTEADIDFCSLANNHVLDWGYAGLAETVETLKKANVKFAGAGRNQKEAKKPAVMEIEGKGRVIVFSYGSVSSGIPHAWGASGQKPGVNLLKDMSDETARHIKKDVESVKRPGDIVVASIHWGGNWGYNIPANLRFFAQKLIDEAGVHLIHGHSSHHIRGIEVYKEKLILYGCGDFINDYEGIGGYEEFRGDLSLMYFARLDPSNGKLLDLRMMPTRIKNLKVNIASDNEVLWLEKILNREGRKFGTGMDRQSDNSLVLRWN